MNNTLEHHGVLGMKWGVRRYQNPNGSLTTEGKRRAKQNESVQKTYSKDDKEADKILYGKRGQKRIEKRMQKGNSHFVVEGKEWMRNMAITGALSIGTADFITKGAFHRMAGQLFVNQMKHKKMRDLIPKIAQNKYYDPIDVAYKILK